MSMSLLELHTAIVESSTHGSNHYTVMTNNEHYDALWTGETTGELGVVSGTTLLPGTKVIIVVDPSYRRAYILGVAPYLGDITSAENPRFASLYPLASGLDLDNPSKSPSGVGIQTGLLGQFWGANQLPDLPPGAWSKTSPLTGCGVGVEQFRAWLRGGAISGLWCYPERELTRLLGLELEVSSLHRRRRDRRRGNAFESVESWHRDLKSADQGLAQRRAFAGRQYGGWVDQVTAEDGTVLFQHQLAQDGFLGVTSARGIMFQRYLGLPKLKELVDGAAEYGDTAVGGTLGEESQDASIDLKLKQPDAPKTLAETSPDARVADPSGPSWLFQLQDTIELYTTSVQRNLKEDPLYHDDKNPVVPRDPDQLPQYSEDWLAPLQTVTVPLLKGDNPENRDYFQGRSSFGLMPDGSFVVQDAWGSEIRMSGGNIQFSAAHDIIGFAGRHFLGIAGRDAAVRAGRHVDVSANEGRVSVKAEQQLSLLGGNDGGAEGVLIESKSANDQGTAGTGSTGHLGGVVVKSKGSVQLYGEQNVFLRAEKGNIGARADHGQTILDAQAAIFKLGVGGFIVSLSDGSANYAFEQHAFTTPDKTGVVIGGQLLVMDSIVSGGSIGAKQSIGAGSGVAIDKQPDLANTIAKNIASARATVQSLNGQVASTLGLWTTLISVTAVLGTKITQLGFSFLTSVQRGIQGARSWLITEPEWSRQQLSRGTWAERPVQSPAGDGLQTAAFPGYEAWASDQRFVTAPTPWVIDRQTGEIKQDPGVDVPATTTTTLNQNLRTAGTY